MKFVGHIDDEELLKLGLSSKKKSKAELTAGKQNFVFKEGVNYNWDELRCLSQFFPKRSYRLSKPSDLKHSPLGVHMLQTVTIEVDVTLSGD